MDAKTMISDVKETVREFYSKRDWGQFHNAKDLAIGIVTEASELLDLFRFKSVDEVNAMFGDDEKRDTIEQEIADVFYFLLSLSERYDVDLTTALEKKLKINSKKYPVEKVKGRNEKYTEYD